MQFIKAQEQELDVTMSDAIRILSLLKVNMLRTVDDTHNILEMLRADEARDKMARLDNIMADGNDAISRVPSKRASLRAVAMSPSTTKTSHHGMLQLGDMSPNSGMHDTNSWHNTSTLPGAPMNNSNQGTNAFAGIGGSSAEVLAQLGRMQVAFEQQQQQMLEAVTTRLADQQHYIEERDAWMEQRIAAVERRCEKVLIASEKVLACLQGVDFTEIMELPSRMEHMLPARRRSTFDDDNSTRSPGQSMPAGATRNLEHKLDALGEQVQNLLVQADEAAEGRKMLWKIDMGIRQIRAGVPLPEHRPRMGTDTGSNAQAPSHRQGVVRMADAQHGSMLPRTPPGPDMSPGGERCIPGVVAAGDWGNEASSRGARCSRGSSTGSLGSRSQSTPTGGIHRRGVSSPGPRPSDMSPFRN